MKCRGERSWFEEANRSSVGLQLYVWKDYSAGNASTSPEHQDLDRMKAIIEKAFQDPNLRQSYCTVPDEEERENDSRNVFGNSRVVYCDPETRYSIRLWYYLASQQRETDKDLQVQVGHEVRVECQNVALTIARETVNCFDPKKRTLEQIETNKPYDDEFRKETEIFKPLAWSWWSQDPSWGVLMGLEKSGCPSSKQNKDTCPNDTCKVILSQIP